MNVVRAGVVIGWEPSGYTVVGWHRHDHLVESGASDDVYAALSRDEMFDVVGMHLSSYCPGDPCVACTGQQQIQLWADARKPERT